MSVARPGRGKKLLVARAGLGALTIVAASAFPACNLVPPVCTDGGGVTRGRCDPPPDARPDARDATAPIDGAPFDAMPSDGAADDAARLDAELDAPDV